MNSRDKDKDKAKTNTTGVAEFSSSLRLGLGVVFNRQTCQSAGKFEVARKEAEDLVKRVPDSSAVLSDLEAVGNMSYPNKSCLPCATSIRADKVVVEHKKAGDEYTLRTEGLKVDGVPESITAIVGYFSSLQCTRTTGDPEGEIFTAKCHKSVWPIFDVDVDVAVDLNTETRKDKGPSI